MIGTARFSPHFRQHLSSYRAANSRSVSTNALDDVWDLVQQVYEQGGEAMVLMSTPTAIRRISEYMFTDTARIATLQSDQQKSTDPAAALGTVPTARPAVAGQLFVLYVVPQRVRLNNSDVTRQGERRVQASLISW